MCNLLHAIIACNLLHPINCTCNHRFRLVLQFRVSFYVYSLDIQIAPGEKISRGRSRFQDRPDEKNRQIGAPHGGRCSLKISETHVKTIPYDDRSRLCSVKIPDTFLAIFESTQRETTGTNLRVALRPRLRTPRRNGKCQLGW